MATILFTGALAVCGATTARAADEPSKEGVEFFEKNIRPVLSDSCYKCHSAKAQANKKLKAKLYLDSFAGMAKGGESGTPAVVPGKPDESALIKSIRYQNKGDDEDLNMPPAKEGKSNKLADDVIKKFEEWIKMGAPHPKEFESAPKAEGSTTDQPGAKSATAAATGDDAKNHWSFIAPKAIAPPEVKNTGWAKNDLDHFVLAKLEAAGLTPSPAADRRTLIRRVTFDLTGLPPTPEEVAAFEQDKSAGAYEAVVDRLLASPAYGERWGRHWLDVARYSDTKGYVFQEERRYPYAYTYRDWVINALNTDLPYDQFLIRQIAADRLDLGKDNRDLAAMGFLTVGRRFLNQAPDIIDDRMDVVCRGTMALTVACARCHDHKFDPIPTKDYYGLYGIFASSVEPKELPLIGSSDATPTSLAFETELKARQAVVSSFIDDNLRKLFPKMLTAEGLGDALLSTTKRAPTGKDSTKNPEVAIDKRWGEYLKNQEKKHDPIFAAWRAYKSIPAAQFANRSKSVIDKLRGGGSEGPTTHPLVLAEFEMDPPASLEDVAQRYGQLLAKYDKPQALENPDEEALRLVLRGPESPLAVDAPYAEKFFPNALRSKLKGLQQKVGDWQLSDTAPARAMCLEDSPTPGDAPILVRGNARSPGQVVPRKFLTVAAGIDAKPYTKGSGRLEFAKAIASKSNPLTARVFVNRVWEWHFGTGIVRTPSDFGMRSDPPTDPQLLDWMAVRFMDDDWSIKKLQKLIVTSATYRQSSADRPEARKIDPENAMYWRFNRQRLDFEETRDSLIFVTGKLDTKTGGPAVDIMKPEIERRTVYGFIDRQNLPSIYRAFDFASPDTHAPQRFNTTVPQQALFFMNSPFTEREAKLVVAREDVAKAADTEARIQYIYRLLFGREPNADELKLGKRFVENAPEEKAMGPWDRYAQVLLESNEFVFVD
jgi:hypothetical protein